MYIDGNYLYFTTSGAFHVADVSDPANPSVIGSYTAITYTSSGTATNHTTSDISAKGDYVFVATGTGNSSAASTNGIYVFDVSAAKASGTKANPVAPVLLQVKSVASTLTTYRRISNVTVNGDFLYVMEQDNALIRMYDVSDPTHLTVISSKATSSANGYGPKDVFLKGDKIYFCDNQAGFAVYKVTQSETGDITITKNGVLLENLQSGDLTASMDVVNYSADTLNVHIIMALYDDGELENIHVVPKTLFPGKSSTLTSVMNIPSSQGYRLKTMLWDNTEDMNLLSVKWDTTDSTKAIGVGSQLLPN